MDEEGARPPYLTWTRTCSFSVTAMVLWVCLCCVFTQARWYKVLLVPVGRTPVSFSTFTPGFPLLCFSSRPLAWQWRSIIKKMDICEVSLWWWTRLLRIISGSGARFLFKRRQEQANAYRTNVWTVHNHMMNTEKDVMLGNQQHNTFPPTLAGKLCSLLTCWLVM